MPDSSSRETEDITKINQRVNELAVSDPSGGLFPKTKANKIAFGIFLGVITACFLSIALWLNWPKERPESEPLPENVRNMISRLPHTTNVLMYVGMDNVRRSEFWKTILPDSVKQSSFISDSSSLSYFAKETDIVLTEDVDTLLYAASSYASPNDTFISILSGRFNPLKIQTFLDSASTNARQYNSLVIHRIEPKLWFSLKDSTQIILASLADHIEDYLSASNDYFNANPRMAHLLDITHYKSHLWMALGNAGWASGAMRGLTASNSELKNMGNLRQIQQLVLSLKLDEGLKGQTEWIYQSRTSAFFAYGLLWLAVRVSGSEGTRLKTVEKEILNAIEIQQNQESIILRGTFSNELISTFRNKDKGF